MLEFLEGNSLTEGTLEALENLHHFQIELGVNERLLRHHELTLLAAIKIVNGLPVEFRKTLNTFVIFAGTFFHDIGKAKILYSEELYAEGKNHEASGRDLLILLGFPKEIANFCISDDIDSVEKLISVIADRIWAGVRCIDLELILIELVSSKIGKEFWETYVDLDDLFEEIGRYSFLNYREYISLYT
ncbi:MULTISPECIES: hypothetical protein, partial [Leptospira]|uniref:hypothetical protein n=1 Tax=Leptospira TaxID=171 RepID=UPI00214BE540